MAEIGLHADLVVCRQKVVLFPLRRAVDVEHELFVFRLVPEGERTT
jgi:hypothetical protein